jgi:hypothetical protein
MPVIKRKDFCKMSREQRMELVPKNNWSKCQTCGAVLGNDTTGINETDHGPICDFCQDDELATKLGL